MPSVMSTVSSRQWVIVLEDCLLRRQEKSLHILRSGSLGSDGPGVLRVLLSPAGFLCSQESRQPPTLEGLELPFKDRHNTMRTFDFFPQKKLISRLSSEIEIRTREIPKLRGWGLSRRNL